MTPLGGCLLAADTEKVGVSDRCWLACHHVSSLQLFGLVGSRAPLTGSPPLYVHGLLRGNPSGQFRHFFIILAAFRSSELEKRLLDFELAISMCAPVPRAPTLSLPTPDSRHRGHSTTRQRDSTAHDIATTRQRYSSTTNISRCSRFFAELRT